MRDRLTREEIMEMWDSWRSYIAKGGGGSWPRDAFESILDYFDELLEECENDKNND